MAKAFSLIEILIVVAIVGILIACLAGSGPIRCSLAGSDMQRKTKWTLFSGCLVEAKTGWVPLKQLRGEVE